MQFILLKFFFQILLHFNLSFAGLSIIVGFFYQWGSLYGYVNFFQSFKGVIIIFLIMILYPIPAIISLLTTIDREGIVKHIHETLPNIYDIFITAPCNTFIINTQSYIYFGIVCFQIFAGCFTGWIINFFIQKKLNELKQSSLSSQTLRARRQLIYALLIQMAIPLITIAAPIFAMIIAVIVKLKHMRGR